MNTIKSHEELTERENRRKRQERINKDIEAIKPNLEEILENYNLKELASQMDSIVKKFCLMYALDKEKVGEDHETYGSMFLLFWLRDLFETQPTSYLETL